ncbi:MAG: hypothetical protein K0Q68_1865, partial [Moraxellaceae bacterium]|nr:hypothetical protein [Moraxellaceae bacterium]
FVVGLKPDLQGVAMKSGAEAPLFAFADGTGRGEDYSARGLCTLAIGWS